MASAEVSAAVSRATLPSLQSRSSGGLIVDPDKCIGGAEARVLAAITNGYQGVTSVARASLAADSRDPPNR